MTDDPRTLPPPLTDPTGSPYVTFRSNPGHIGQVIDFDHVQRTVTVHWGTVDAAWAGRSARNIDRQHPWDDLTPVDYTPPGMVLIPVTDPDEQASAIERLAEIEAEAATAGAFPDYTDAAAAEHAAAQELKATPTEELDPLPRIEPHEYSPGPAQYGGDCSVCGHAEASLIHTSPPADAPMAHEKGAEPGDPCPECDGSGVTVEHHGPGLDEPLGCQNCAGTGTVHKPTCPIWRGDFACTCLADGA